MTAPRMPPASTMSGRMSSRQLLAATKRATTCPVVIDTAGNGFLTTSAADGVWFDYGAGLVRAGWIARLAQTMRRQNQHKGQNFPIAAFVVRLEPRWHCRRQRGLRAAARPGDPPRLQTIEARGRLRKPVRVLDRDYGRTRQKGRRYPIRR